MKDFFETLAKWRDGLLVLLACIYGCGYVTWAIHASMWNLAASPGFDLQYFTGGVGPFFLVFLLYLVFRHVPPWLSAFRKRLSPQAKGWKRFLRHAIPICFGVSLGWMIFLSKNRPGTSNAWRLITAESLFILSSLFYPENYDLKLREKERRVLLVLLSPFVLLVNSYARFIRFVFPGVLFCGMVVGTIVLYVAVAYTLIPQQFGGIRPREARLDIRTEAVSAETLEFLGVGKTDRSPVMRSRIIAVVFQGADRIWLAASPARQDSEVIEIQRDAVTGISWLNGKSSP